MGEQRCQLKAKTGTEATYAPAAALLHLLRSALIMKRELSVGRWAFFNKIIKAAFSPKQESKVFAAVSQHRDAFGMGGNAPTHSSHRSHSWVPRGRSGSRCFPSCSASTLCWCFSKSCETSFPACCAPGTRPEGDSSQLARLLALNLTFEELAPIFAAWCLPGSSLLQGRCYLLSHPSSPWCVAGVSLGAPVIRWDSLVWDLGTKGSITSRCLASRVL